MMPAQAQRDIKATTPKLSISEVVGLAVNSRKIRVAVKSAATRRPMASHASTLDPHAATWDPDVWSRPLLSGDSSEPAGSSAEMSELLQQAMQAHDSRHAQCEAATAAESAAARARAYRQATLLGLTILRSERNPSGFRGVHLDESIGRYRIAGKKKGGKTWRFAVEAALAYSSRKFHEWRENDKYKALVAMQNDGGYLSFKRDAAVRAEIEQELQDKGAEVTEEAYGKACYAAWAELSAEERTEFLESLGVEHGATGLTKLIREVYALLRLRTYYTSGETETKAWTISQGTLAPQAAGVIHSDFERGFIRAETVGYDDLVGATSFRDAKEHGLVRSEGKEYEVQDGDVILFRFNV